MQNIEVFCTSCCLSVTINSFSNKLHCIPPWPESPVAPPSFFYIIGTFHFNLYDLDVARTNGNGQ